MSMVAKDASQTFSFHRSAMQALQTLIQSTRELAMLITSGKLLPRTIERGHTAPAERTNTSNQPSTTSGDGPSESDTIPSINVNAPLL
jgi:hypothetical protein